MAPIPSPCTRICVVDPHSGLCEGCGRTLAEIVAWSGLNDRDRLDLMRVLPDRMRAAGLRPAGSTLPGQEA